MTRFLGQFLELGGRHPGHFFELVGQVCYAAVVQSEGYFLEVVLLIGKQFFHALDSGGDEVLLDGNACDLGKQVGEVVVMVVEFSGDVVGKMHFSAAFRGVNEFYHEVFDLLCEDGFFVFHQLQSEFFQRIADFFSLGIAEGLGCFYRSECEGGRGDSKFFQFGLHDLLGTGAGHMFDVQGHGG